MKKLKVGIAGFGIVGKRRKTFIDMNNFLKTVAVSDVTFKRRVKVENNVTYYNDYNALFQHGIDILFVCLPNYLAADATLKGLKNGMHVFCEKPPGKDLCDIIMVCEEEALHPLLKLKYGFNHRYHDSFIEAKKIINSRKYGKIINIKGIYGKSRIIPFDGGWRSKRELAGGGILLDQGIHMLDMIRNIAGDFEEIHSFVSNNYWKHDVEDNAYAILRNKKGCIAMIHSSATQWQHRFRLEITLADATLELTGILSGSKSYGEEKLKIIPRIDNSINGSFDEISKSFLEDHSWKSEIDEFVQIIIQDQHVLIGNSYDALKVMELVQKIYFSDHQWKNKFNINIPKIKTRGNNGQH